MGVRSLIRQGDILKIEKIKNPVLVVSKDFFNQTGNIIGCPIFENREIGALHVMVETKELTGCVQCEKLALLDLNVRGFSKISCIQLADRMEISDVIQGIFDYV